MSGNRFSKKLLSLLLSIVMMIASIPFTTITASAQTSTLLPVKYGMIGSGPSRWNGNSMTIVNDQESTNLSAGILYYSLTPYADKHFSRVEFNVTLDTAIGDSEIDNLNFYYSTSYMFSSYTDYQIGKWTSLSSQKFGSGKVGPNNIANTLEMDGKLLYQTKTQGTAVVDVTDVFNSLIASGKNDLYIIIMHNKAGGKAATSGWSDTVITPSNIKFNLEYEDATTDNLKYDIRSKISAWNMPTESQPVMYNGTKIGINSNVLYSSNTFVDCNFTAIALNDKPNDTTINVKAMAPVGSIVYIYTKAGDEKYAKIPIIAETDRVSSCLKRYQLNYISSPSNWTFDTYWYAPTKFSSWDIADPNGDFGKYVVSSDLNNDVTNFTSNTGGIDFDAGWNFDNIASYTGSVNFTNNYMKLPNPVLWMSFDGFCTWNGGSSAIDNVVKSNIPFANAGVSGYYLLDFSTMKDMYGRVKKEFAAISANENAYTEDSLYKYYKATRQIIGYDATTGYDYQLDVGPKASGKDMKAAIDAYNSAYKSLVKKTFNISIEYNNGYTTKTETISAVYGTTFEDAIKNFSTSKIYNFCKWTNAPEIITSNFALTYSEHIEAREEDVENKKIVVHCSDCGAELPSIQLDEYYAAKTLLEVEIADTEKYTQAGIDKMTDVLTRNVLSVETDTTSSIDAKVTEMRSVITFVNDAPIDDGYVNSFDVKFVTVDDVNDVETVEFANKVKYNTLVDFKADNGYTPYKWVRDGYSNRIANTNKELSLVINEDTTVYAHYKGEAEVNPLPKLIFCNQLGKPTDIIYVDINSIIVSKNGQFIINDNEVVKLDKLPFYEIVGYIIADEEPLYMNENEEFVIDCDAVIQPVYQPVTN